MGEHEPPSPSCMGRMLASRGKWDEEPLADVGIWQASRVQNRTCTARMTSLCTEYYPGPQLGRQICTMFQFQTISNDTDTHEEGLDAIFPSNSQNAITFLLDMW